ncbi:MAG: hypothetical protein MPN21_03895 [Thermoanaerobaculia bacterium]|nr:hypothetical protein [Thermoanaerobaculia bacterium]
MTFFLVLLLLVLGAVALERNLRPWRAYYSEPGVGAQWIWAPDTADSGVPTTFWLVRDMDWPSSTALAGRLAIAAAEGYELWLNGQRVGSRQTAIGGARIESDLYDVTGFLEAGVNRIVVEVRSSRGAGGLLASLRDAEGQPLLVTDGSWRVVRRFDRALLQGRTPSLQIDDSEPPAEAPVVWGHPPTGRWRVGTTQNPRKLPDLRPTAPTRFLPMRLRYPSPGSQWHPVKPQNRYPSVKSQRLVDFGEEITAFLALDFHRTPDAKRDGAPMLLFLSRDRLPRPGLQDLRPDVVAVPMPGAPGWRDLHPRRFRYVAVIGAPPGSSLVGESASGGEASAWMPPVMDHQGVFGLRPATGYTPVEEMVWNRLGGVSRVQATDVEDGS